MDDSIERLSKERWKGYSLPMHYTADSYTDVRVERDGADFTVTFRKRPLAAPVEHRPDEEYGCPDKLYAAYWEDAEAWGVVRNGELMAAIEICPETWSNRLRVTELWVTEELRGQGVGRRLMDLAKERTRRDRRRALILETQSCNSNALEFYLHQGFTLIGFDACCYTNDDLARREVRMELGWFPEKESP